MWFSLADLASEYRSLDNTTNSSNPDGSPNEHPTVGTASKLEKTSLDFLK
jgi:hypothetical protein